MELTGAFTVKAQFEGAVEENGSCIGIVFPASKITDAPSEIRISTLELPAPGAPVIVRSGCTAFRTGTKATLDVGNAPYLVYPYVCTVDRFGKYMSDTNVQLLYKYVDESTIETTDWVDDYNRLPGSYTSVASSTLTEDIDRRTLTGRVLIGYSNSQAKRGLVFIAKATTGNNTLFATATSKAAVAP